MLQKPKSAGLPFDAAKMNDVAGKPHAGMVVQIASFGQFLAKGIDAGQPRFAITDISR